MSSWSLTILDGERIRYSDEYFGIPAEHLLEVGRLWAQVEELAATVPPRGPVAGARRAQLGPPDM
ncbi:hypothetical protein [Mycobacteroides abscessus]|uniref:hypothetical protein n=1 Tax=Mycobacteroides abscessus TaxID=36809 RepID=UPI0009416A15|nr:hypothetical protein [Mycobacteroides abscessus]